MEKVLVSLNIPAVSEKMDVYIPTFLSIKEIIELLVSGVEEATERRYTSSGNERLCSEERNIILPYTKTLKQCGVVNGEHLVLI